MVSLTNIIICIPKSHLWFHDMRWVTSWKCLWKYFESIPSSLTRANDFVCDHFLDLLQYIIWELFLWCFFFCFVWYIGTFFSFIFVLIFFVRWCCLGQNLEFVSKTSNLCPHGYEICKQINYLILFLKIRFENIINVSPSWVWDFFSFLFGNFNYQLLYISQFQQDT